METPQLIFCALVVIAIACGLSLIWNIYNDTPRKRWERNVRQAERDRKNMI